MSNGELAQNRINVQQDLPDQVVSPYNLDARFISYRTIVEKIAFEMGIQVSPDYLIHLHRTHNFPITETVEVLGRFVERVPESRLSLVMQLVHWHEIDNLSWKDIRFLLTETTEQKGERQTIEALLEWNRSKSGDAWESAMQHVIQQAKLNEQEELLIYARQRGIGINESALRLNISLENAQQIQVSAENKIGLMLLEIIGNGSSDQSEKIKLE